MTDLAEATAAVTYGSPRLRELIEHIAQDALGRDERDELPFEPIDAVRRARLGAIRLPVAQGGGASLVELYKVFIELGAADSNVAHILRSHFGVVENLLRGPGPGGAGGGGRGGRGGGVGGAAPA
ncbi:hypothetical protein MXD61_10585, partial [Frankia sp. AgPm24]